MTVLLRYLSCITCASAFILGLNSSALAAEHHMNAKAIVKYRQEVMKSQGAHMAASAAIIMGKVGYKDQLAGHVNALKAMTHDIASLFPPGSDVGKTKALKKVWTEHTEFEKKAHHAADMASALAKAVAEGDSKSYGMHFKALVNSCKSCHKEFRHKEM